MSKKEFEILQQQIIREGSVFHVATLTEEIEELTRRLNLFEEFILEKLNLKLEDLIKYEQNRD